MKNRRVRYYVGSIQGQRKVVCEKHLPKLEDEPRFVGMGLLCSLCKEKEKVQKSLWGIIQR